MATMTKGLRLDDRPTVYRTSLRRLMQDLMAAADVPLGVSAQIEQFLAECAETAGMQANDIRIQFNPVAGRLELVGVSAATGASVALSEIAAAYRDNLDNGRIGEASAGGDWALQYDPINAGGEVAEEGAPAPAGDDDE